MTSEILLSEVQFLELLLIAILVAIAVKYIRLPYTIALVLCGLVISLVGFKGISLSEELIMLIFLPPLIFEGAIHIDLETLKENLLIILTLAFLGLIAAIIITGFLMYYLVSIPLLIALLFGAMIMPTDPVSVLAMFKKLGVSKRLSTIIEGESLFNDGTGVVLFTVILSIIETQKFSIILTIFDFLRVVILGLGIGFITGYAAYRILRHIDDHLIEVVLTGILAYGTFIICEHFHVSGVMGVLAAGLLIGNKGRVFAMSPKTRVAIQETWELVAFIINSLIFLMIGTQIPIGEIATHISLVLVSIFVVVLARAISVYLPLLILNLKLQKKVPLTWIHVINWSGLHGSIPIALLLSLHESQIPEIKAHLDELYFMVFGVVLFSLVFQGLSMEFLIKKLRLIERKQEFEKYDRLLAEKIAIQQALNELKAIRDRREIPAVLYDELEKDLKHELDETAKNVEELITKYPEIKEKQMIYAKKRMLLAKKAAIHGLMIKGMISEDLANEIIKEIDSKLDEMTEL